MLVAGNVKLIDFGIANALQQDKTSLLRDARTGTPSYMSPEAIMAAYDDGGDDSGEDKENMNKKAKPKYKVGMIKKQGEYPCTWLFSEISLYHSG